MKKILVLFFLCFVFINLKAQTSINDEPCGAIQLPVTSLLCYQSFSLVSATPTTNPYICYNNIYNDIWFYFYFPANSEHIVIDIKSSTAELFESWDCNNLLGSLQICLQSDTSHIVYSLTRPIAYNNEPIYIGTTGILDSVRISVHELPISPLVVNYTSDLTLLVNNFVESGVSVSNVLYSGAPHAIGSFTGGYVTNLGLSDGIILASGDVKSATGPNISPSMSSNFGTGSDPDLALINPSFTIHDASVLQFDIIPEGNILTYNYVFGSEEYPEYVNSSFNDVFGLFITGPNPTGGTYNHENVALIPNTNSFVCIDNVNSNINSQYFVDNTNGLTLQYDGFTTVLPIFVHVVPFQVYHLKIAVGDCGDSAYDSGIFLQSPSLKSYTITEISENTSNFEISIFPNPLNENSVISYNLSSDENVSIDVYNVLGKKVETLLNELQEQGKYNLSLNPITKQSTGIYFIKFKTKKANLNYKVIVE